MKTNENAVYVITYHDEIHSQELVGVSDTLESAKTFCRDDSPYWEDHESWSSLYVDGGVYMIEQTKKVGKV